MGVKMGWIQIKMGHPLARNGAALAPFRAKGAHPSYYHFLCIPPHLRMPTHACALFISFNFVSFKQSPEEGRRSPVETS